MSSIFIYSQFVEIDSLRRPAAVSAASGSGVELQPIDVHSQHKTSIHSLLHMEIYEIIDSEHLETPGLELAEVGKK